ncbi:hypothetical protein CANARDRAFT_26139 [[Candida] arabinofermentans NRRL YB-2248]|uniref:Inositolphosphotransferase Aur1/Ipt1 domain-containing protein n=1 Tax=[Candida] arabinofermentans NRRL YB-2248 TaxID=983967 RepID=A0A1E4T8A8_9ASCO|nr:hypothetical protein CANARDRAFT_26139 [[Candida] arabinofermentans NRRL YB-2248]
MLNDGAVTGKSLPMLAYRLVRFLISQVLNGRNIFMFIFNFFRNFSPVFLWLMIFKNASIIPNEIRPDIHVRLAKHLDSFMFDMNRLSAWISLILILCISYLLWFNYYKIDNNLIFPTNLLNLKNQLFDLENDIELDSLSGGENNQNIQREREREREHGHGHGVNIDDKINLPKSCISYTVPLLLALSWIILNFDHLLINHQTTPLDLIAWTSYVLFHFFAPLFTAIYLYVFQTPGALKYFSFCLGTQNIAGVLTHLLFPNAPPWFIHLYGEDASADYDMPGYAAGLARVDVALGTHLNSKGFHKSPIVFGALPSLHSAMAVQSFLFISWYTNWYFPKIGMFMFVILQWWATMYLDHHWRLDLIIGLLYAVLSFGLFKKQLLKYEKNFVNGRLKGDFKTGSTLGMRIFKYHSTIQRFFDPYN